MQVNTLINSKWSFSGTYDPRNLKLSYALLFNKLFLKRLFSFLAVIFEIIKFKIDSKKSLNTSEFNTKLGQLLTDSFIKLGPFFIKLGQFLSVRADFLSTEVTCQLKTLLDKVPAEPIANIDAAFKHDFNQSYKDIFVDFEPIALASASIAQVHKAKLKDSNETIVVKIQRPYLPGQFYIDLILVKYSIVIYNGFINKLNLKYFFELIDELGGILFDELNFLQEAKNANEIRQNLKSLNYVKIPKIIWNLTGRHIICMEYIESAKISQITLKRNIDSFIVKTFSCYLQQALIYGLFHADPHESTIGISSSNDLVIYDFGIVGKLENDVRHKIINLILSAINKDVNKATDILYELNIICTGVNPETVKEILGIIVHSKEKNNFQSNDMNKLFKLLKELDNNWSIPPQLYLLFKTTYYLSGFLISIKDKTNIEYIIFEVVKDLITNIIVQKG